jgi:hypothetical protein
MGWAVSMKPQGYAVNVLYVGVGIFLNAHTDSVSHFSSAVLKFRAHEHVFLCFLGGLAARAGLGAVNMLFMEPFIQLSV